MSRGNDGYSTQMEFSGRLAGQDQKHFALGTSPAPPSARYFADARGLENEQVIWDAIAGLSSERRDQGCSVQTAA